MEYIKNNLIQKIEDKIKKENIKMKPKWFFILKTVLNISFVLILFLATVYVLNFVFFIFYDHKSIFDALHLSPFEVKNLFDFLKMIPVFLIFLIFIFIFSLYKLIDNYAFIYRKRKLYIILFIFIFIFITVFNMHKFLDRDFKMARFGERGEFPILQNVHKYYRGQDFMKDGPYMNNLIDKSYKTNPINR